MLGLVVKTKFQSCRDRRSLLTGSHLGPGWTQMELEIGQLDRKYSYLRVTSRLALARLVASIADIGQQNPVLVVVPEAGGKAVLIDGYLRVEWLERLGRDTVQALQLAVNETEALLMRQRMAVEERRSALEDGWLLQELHIGHRLSQSELALRLGKSVSWVSRRLGLVRDLPEDVQNLVRLGHVPAHAAMKYLLPLARAISEACARLTQSLDGSRWTVREIGQIYETWRKSSPEVRARIEANPRNFCKSLPLSALALPDCDAPLRELLVSLGRLGGMCRRLQALVSVRLSSDGSIETLKALTEHWKPTQRDVQALQERMQRLVSHD